MLYDNRFPLEIFSLVPCELSKHPRNSTSVHHIHLPAFLYVENVIEKDPRPSLGFDKWGHCTQLHPEVRSGFVLVPWGSRAIPAESHSHLCAGPKKTTTGTQCFPGITNVFISTAVPSSTNLTRFLPTNGRVSLCAISNSYLKIIHFLKKRFPVCSRGHKDSTQRIKSFSKPTVLGEN